MIWGFGLDWGLSWGGGYWKCIMTTAGTQAKKHFLNILGFEIWIGIGISLRGGEDYETKY